MLTLQFIFFYFFSFGAKSFVFPKVNKEGVSLEALSPKNWTVIDVSYGDLNGDQTDDMAFILEYNQVIEEVRAYGDNHSNIIKENQKPRILAIYFKDPARGIYQLATQNNDFILRSEEGGQLGDPLLKMEIKNDQLYLRFKGGNLWRWETGYTFKYLKKDWCLTYAINLYYDSTSGSMTERIFDFENRELYSTFGNLHQRSIANYKTSEVLYFSDIRTFKTFKKPWAWQVMPDIYL